MAIFISASMLDDYIACNRRVYYRLNSPESSIQNKEMVVGNIVHKAIELYWNDENLAFRYIFDNVSSILPNDKESLEYSLLCIKNFFSNFSQFLSDNDKIEHRFKIKYSDDVFIVGKMDRITSHKIFDWKTTRKPPKSISNSVQFILYNWAYRKLWGVNPHAVYYGALGNGELIMYRHDKVLEDVLIHELIPEAVKAIKGKNFIRNGIFRKQCFRCQYSSVCLKEFEWDG